MSVRTADRRRQRITTEPLERRALCSVTTYDVVGDFSSTLNPNGVWSYGSLTDTLTPAATFTVLPIYTQTLAPNLTAWQATTTGSPPAVGENQTGSTLVQGTLAVPTGVLYMHPGQDGTFADARFTAPAAGTVSLTYGFAGVDSHPTTTDVHVLHDGAAIDSGDINGDGAGNTSDGQASFLVAAGDTVDFAVGYGTNKTYDYDSTSLTAHLSLDTTELTAAGTLATSAVTSTVPTTVVAGAKVKGTVRGTFTATVATKGAAAVTVYATADGRAADGTAVATLPRKVNLKAGRAQRFVIPVRSLPASLSPGTYTLVARTTDPAGGVSDATAGTLTVAAPTVDLSTSTLADARPTTVRPGHATVALLTLTNGGNSDAVGTLTVSYVVSTDATLAGAVSATQAVTKKVTVRAGRTLRLPLPVRVASTAVAGPYRVAATVSLAGTVVGTVTASLATADSFTVR